jgi:SAM-dependent methyltransferase
MKLSLLKYLLCPSCEGGGALTCTGGVGGEELESGELTCPSCAKRYPVRDGIPRFVPETNYADSFGYQWNLFSQTQLDAHWGSPISAARFKSETRWPLRLAGELILEAGCGMGRFTEHAAATGAELISIDYSSAIDAARKNNAQRSNVHFVQADIYNLPFRRELFDRVFCFGVLQHCPDPKQAFLSLIPFLKRGGTIAVDVYRKSWRTLFFGTYYLRLFTKGRPPAKLFPWVRRYFNVMYAATGAVRRISPRAAGYLTALSGIADYRGVYDINEARMEELCLLDTFDHLSPAHDHPQTLGAVKKWVEEASLIDTAVQPGCNGIEAHGRKR